VFFASVGSRRPLGATFEIFSKLSQYRLSFLHRHFSLGAPTPIRSSSCTPVTALPPALPPDARLIIPPPASTIVATNHSKYSNYRLADLQLFKSPLSLHHPRGAASFLGGEMYGKVLEKVNLTGIFCSWGVKVKRSNSRSPA